MAVITGKELIEKAKKAKKLPVVIFHDGEYYDVTSEYVQILWVKKEKDWTGGECYGIADEGSEGAFPVFAIG